MWELEEKPKLLHQAGLKGRADEQQLVVQKNKLRVAYLPSENPALIYLVPVAFT